MNPSLLDLIRPIIEQAGFTFNCSQDTGVVYDAPNKDVNRSILITHIVQRAKGACGTAYLANTWIQSQTDKMCKERGVSPGYVIESLHPSDPLFLQKLAEWLKPEEK